MSFSEKELLFEREMLPLTDALYHFALHLTHDHADAEDLVQDTYLRAFNAVEHYTANSNAKAWLFRILKNVFINKFRAEQSHPKILALDDSLAFGSTTDEDNDIRNYINDDDPTPDDDTREPAYDQPDPNDDIHLSAASNTFLSVEFQQEFFATFMGDEVMQAVGELPAEARTLILLDLEDFTYREIADILGVQPNRVRSRLFRARNMLKALLQQYAQAQGLTDKRSPQPRKA